MRWFKLVALLIFVLALILIGLVTWQLRSPDPNTNQKIDFVISDKQSSREVADKLYGQKIIKNSFAFYLYLKLTRSHILPGTYEISASQSATEIVSIISLGQFKTANITITEGWRVTQMADYLIEEKRLTNITDFVAQASQYEGYLFPDTYNVKIDISAGDLINLMRENFTKKTKAVKLTPETVILASIVEREAKNDEERSMIAGVYANRLKIGMLLQADPTVQYAKGNWAAPRKADLAIDSPYNTYIHTGLPPGPIASPGLASLAAAAQPAEHDYFFFFHAQGQIFYSKTAAEHQAKVAKYF